MFDLAPGQPVSPSPKPKSGETESLIKYNCTGTKDGNGNDLIRTSGGKLYYCDAKFGTVCGEGRCNTGLTPKNFDYNYDDWISKLERFEKAFNIDSSLQKQIAKLQQKYRIYLTGEDWSLENLDILDAALRDLPPDLYRNREFMAIKPDNNTSQGFTGETFTNLPLIKINFNAKNPPDYQESNNKQLAIRNDLIKTIRHEVAHSSSFNSLGRNQNSDSMSHGLGYDSKLIEEIVDISKWYFDPKINKYLLSSDSPLLNGYKFDVSQNKYVQSSCDKTKKDCNIYWDYQFTNPNENFAVFFTDYVNNSQLFCKQMPSYCPLMKDFADNREYKNGVWINRPPQYGDK